MTTRQAEWDDLQKSILLASTAYEAGIGRYGELITEATDPKASPFYHGEDAIRFEVVGPTVNQAERAVEDAKAAYEKRWGENVPHGLMWGAKKL